MIRNNLAKLLADRSLKITKVSNDTGISRNTITSTAQNDGKMIQLETINTLCQYLQISPEQFFEFLPFDLTFSTYLDDFKIIDNINSDDEFIDNVTVSPFQADAFIKKTSNNQMNGKSEKSFDFTIKSPKEFQLGITDKEDPLRYGETEQPVPLTVPIEVILNNEIGNTEDFNKLWNDDLTAGFRTTILQRIQNKISSDVIEKITANLKPYNNIFQLSWKHITIDYTFIFDTDSQKDTKDISTREMTMTGGNISNQLPF